MNTERLEMLIDDYRLYGEDLPCGIFDELVGLLLEERKRLGGVILKARTMLMESPELNMSNYTEEEVSTLNDSVCETCCVLENDAVAFTKEAPV